MGSHNMGAYKGIKLREYVVPGDELEIVNTH